MASPKPTDTTLEALDGAAVQDDHHLRNAALNRPEKPTEEAVRREQEYLEELRPPWPSMRFK